MSDQKLDCYIIPCEPMPLILPAECVAEVVAEPQVETLSSAPANWMQGHINWNNQRIPVLSYALLQDADVEETKENAHLVVLNPIPHAARKAYSGLLCYGDIRQITVEPNIQFSDMADLVDRRYIDGVVSIEEQDFIIPKLAALGVAFSYF